MSEIPHPNAEWGYVCQNRACKHYRQEKAYGENSEMLWAFYAKGNCPICKTKSIQTYEKMLTSAELTAKLSAIRNKSEKRDNRDFLHFIGLILVLGLVLNYVGCEYQAPTRQYHPDFMGAR